MKIPIISNWIEKRSRESDLLNPKQWLLDALGVRNSISGVAVSESNSTQCSAVFGCVRILSETVASLPLITYRRLERGKERALDHPLYFLLHDQPNSEMTSFTFREMMMAFLLLRGNFFGEIVRNMRGDPIEIWPLLPYKMDVKRVDDELVYKYTKPDGKQIIIPKRNILHIPGLGFDGALGKSVISYAREAIGLSLALEEFGSRFFSGGTNVGGVVEHPQALSDKAYKRLKDELKEKYEGLGKSHRLLILEEGMKYAKTVIPPNDAQFIESRRFQVEEIARMFMVPLHLLQDLTHATFSNVEHLDIGFVVHTMRPWLVRVEQGILKDLYDPEDRKKHFSEFLVDGLLRGDTATRFQAYATAIQNGIYSPNDVLELENRNPYEGGDTHFIALNMQSVEQVGELLKNRQIVLDGKEIRLLPGAVKRSSKTRQRLVKAYREPFKDAVKRIVKRERADILRGAKKIFGERDINLFNDFIDDFYKDHIDYIKKQVKPIMVSYADVIAQEAAEEVNLKDIPEFSTFMNEYVSSFASRYSGKSRAELGEAIQSAIDENKDIMVELESKFDDWEETKPQDVADNETVRLGSAIARDIFVAAGFTPIWVSSPNACPICQELDGKKTDLGPPLHDGCECGEEPANSSLIGP